jgi:HEPN domain-containing protein
MADFIKTKLQAALALLGMLFALRPFVDDIQNVGFAVLDVRINLLHVLAGMAGLLAVSVHCFAFDMLRVRPISLVERLGNLAFGLAVLALPAFGVGWGLTELGRFLAEKYALPQLVWATPAVLAGLFVAWLLFAILIRVRLTRQDRVHQHDTLNEAESTALKRAQEMFDHGHYDLSAIEAFRGLEARLRRALLRKGVHGHYEDWNELRDAAHEAGLLAKVPPSALDDLYRRWKIAVGVDPLPRDEAAAALASVKTILSTIPL